MTQAIMKSLPVSLLRFLITNNNPVKQVCVRAWKSEGLAASIRVDSTTKT